MRKTLVYETRTNSSRSTCCALRSFIYHVIVNILEAFLGYFIYILFVCLVVNFKKAVTYLLLTDMTIFTRSPFFSFRYGTLKILPTISILHKISESLTLNIFKKSRYILLQSTNYNSTAVVNHKYVITHKCKFYWYVVKYYHMKNFTGFLIC